jgi:Spy/CpxP family protein refolding chaperone
MSNGESSRRKAVLWIAAIFVLGASLGGVVGYGYALHHRTALAALMNDDARRARKADQLTREVGLRPEQRQKLDAIIADTHQKMGVIHKQSDAQIDAARQNARAQIRALLTPEQTPKFEEFNRKMDEERKRNAAR